jgi:hypothetical protein
VGQEKKLDDECAGVGIGSEYAAAINWAFPAFSSARAGERNFIVEF